MHILRLHTVTEQRKLMYFMLNLLSVHLLGIYLGGVLTKQRKVMYFMLNLLSILQWLVHYSRFHNIRWGAHN